MIFVIFDDEKRSNFFPITLTRSTGDLRVGILKLRQRISYYFELSETNIIVSAELEAIYKERHSEWKINELSTDVTIFINSRLKIDENTKNLILALQLNESIVNGDTVLAAKCTPKANEINAENLTDLFSNLKKNENKDLKCWEFLWELIEENSGYIKRDFNEVFYDKDNYFETELGTTVINPYNVWIGEGTSIKPGVVIDATEGPVVLDESVTIMANAVIIGPAYIGKGSTIKVGAKIYEGTSIGPDCKIGGEVEETIFQGYSNKQHDGFLGHSYLGEWINLGADTNNSDLRNDYLPIPLYFYPKQKKVDTGCQFVGAVIGDHSKTGINCTINTGTVIGVGCNVVGSDMIINHVPSFRWGFMKTLVEQEFEKFCKIAEAVKRRRKLEFTQAERDLYSMISEQISN